MSSFPWKEILDYIAESGLERDINQFCYKALLGLEKLVNADGSVLQMIGPGRTVLPSSQAHNFSEKALRQYRLHYYKIDPGRTSYPVGITVAAAKWSEFKESEIIVDFLKANRIKSSGGIFLYDYRGDMFAFLNVYKYSGYGFTEHETTIMSVVQPHLNNLLANLTVPSQVEPELITDMEITEDHKTLSKRETEIVACLCRRFSAHQIATMLGISPRTVERHIEHIYDKLGVNKKQELLRLLVTSAGQQHQLSG